MQEKYLENKNNVQLQLIWCDLNPENILINEKNELSCIVNPGGAKYAVKELDLAFVRMEKYIKKYEKYKKQKTPLT